jgi:hypothetical protein
MPLHTTVFVTKVSGLPVETQITKAVDKSPTFHCLLQGAASSLTVTTDIYVLCNCVCLRRRREGIMQTGVTV